MAADVVPSSSGISVLDLRKSLEEVAGREVVATALARLPAETRREFVDITALSWVPVTTIGRVIDEIAAVAGVDPEIMIDEAVRRAVERTFKTVWRVLLRFTTDDALIARTPTMYARSRNVGRLTARIVEAGVSEIILREWPGVSARHVRTLGVSIAAVAELAGRRNVRITSTPTPDGAVYRMTWRT